MPELLRTSGYKGSCPIPAAVIYPYLSPRINCDQATLAALCILLSPFALSPHYGPATYQKLAGAMIGPFRGGRTVAGGGRTDDHLVTFVRSRRRGCGDVGNAKRFPHPHAPDTGKVPHVLPECPERSLADASRDLRRAIELFLKLEKKGL